MSLKEGTYWKGKLKIYRNSSSWGMMLQSADDDDRPHNRNRLSVDGFGWSFWFNVPELIKPVLKQNTYEGKSYTTREQTKYGIKLFEGEHVVVYYGNNAINTENPKRRDWFLPWTQFEHVRHSGYDLQHNHVIDFSNTWEQMNEQRASVPTAVINFDDYDRQPMQATVRIEEREWRRGDKKGWRWLRWFCKPIISRRLEVEYSGETGPRKGEWKGGTIAESIEMLPSESYRDAFHRLRRKRLDEIRNQRRRS